MLKKNNPQKSHASYKKRTTPSRFQWTTKKIAALAPKTAPQIFQDPEEFGLKLTVTKTDEKIFSVAHDLSGKKKDVVLGRFPDLSLQHARYLARQIHQRIIDDLYLQLKDSSCVNDVTLKEAFDKYLDLYAKWHKKTWREDVAQFKRYCRPWQTRLLSSFTREEIQKYHAEIGQKNGLYAANRLIMHLKALFNKMILWGWKGTNPVMGIPLFKEPSRMRFLQSDELPKLFHALDEEKNDRVRDYVLLSLLTGARKHNVLSMRWQDIHFEKALWHIPMTKNGEPHLLPLVPDAIELLKKRRAQGNPSLFVFPSPRTNARHLNYPEKVWKRILARAKIENFRLHDLRRTHATFQAVTGASLHIIGKTLAHKNPSTTAIYARLNLDPVREAMEKATRAMMHAVKNETEK